MMIFLFIVLDAAAEAFWGLACARAVLCVRCDDRFRSVECEMKRQKPLGIDRSTMQGRGARHHQWMMAG
jgi:hypothetical protein